MQPHGKELNMVCVRLKLRVSKQGGENLRIKFGIDNHIAQDTVKELPILLAKKRGGE